jgi:4-hydroxy-tetrahydrodipicolinate reductase
MIRAAVSGTGSMGALVLATLEAAEDIEPVAVLEPQGVDADTLQAASGVSYPLAADPDALFAATSPDVVVDFTNAAALPALVEASLAHGVRPVIGTSGVGDAIIERLRTGSAEAGRGAVVAANFAIGAVVQMHLATIAARYFDAVEVIEMHHDGKVDAPSGTAVETARLMREARGSDFEMNVPETETIEGGRGAHLGGVPLHSVRLPGLVAHQQIIFGGLGQTLTLRHDSTGRDSFMPGVLLAVREVMRRNELVVGLDALVGHA